MARRGKFLLALTPIRRGDWESIAVATNPKFLAIVERSLGSRRPGLSAARVATGRV